MGGKRLFRVRSNSHKSGQNSTGDTRRREYLRPDCLENGLRVAHLLTLMIIGLCNEPVGGYLPSVLY